MTPLDLEITVLSVESLVMPNKGKRKNAVHVTVHVDANEGTREESTSTADVAKGESSATWSNESLLKVSVPMYTRHVAFEVRGEKRSFMGKMKSETIGAATVAVSDLVPCDCLRLLSYRLRDRDGEGSGIVNFSVRVKGLAGGKRVMPESGDRWRQQHREAGGVVMGIPAAWYL